MLHRIVDPLKELIAGMEHTLDQLLKNAVESGDASLLGTEVKPLRRMLLVYLDDFRERGEALNEAGCNAGRGEGHAERRRGW